MTLLILTVVCLILVTVVRRLPKSDCTGNCNQGRNCTCKG